MKISELIEKLEEAIELHGDLEVKVLDADGDFAEIDSQSLRLDNSWKGPNLLIEP